MTFEELKADLIAAQNDLAAAEQALSLFQDRVENNVYASLEKAASDVERTLLSRAVEDCEGSYNCGADTYEREFIVGGVVYVGTLSVEYNRHDKTYYYIDNSDFKFETRADYLINVKD